MMKQLYLACFFLLTSMFSFGQTSDFCARQVQHLDLANQTASAINLTVTNIDANSIKIEIESVTADAVSFLQVNPIAGSEIGATQTLDTSVPGIISRTITWGAPPANVTLEVLWEKDNNSGRWLYLPGGFSVPFAATCAAAPPTSPYCEADETHFDGNPLSNIKLTIANVDAMTMQVIVESTTSAPIENVQINGAAGATQNQVVANGISTTTLTWANTPQADVLFDAILWKKVGAPETWLLSQGPISVPFAAVCSITPPAPMSAYCETVVNHFPDPAGSASEIKLTIKNVDAFSILVEIESTNGDPVDDLLVNGAAGATRSALNTSVPGKISQTLTWALAPTDVSLNVLWSKVSLTPGFWQLSAADIIVPFNAFCPTPAPTSNYCASDELAFGNDPNSGIRLTIANIDAFTMYVEIESSDADPVDLLLVEGIGGGVTISNANTSVPGKISRTITFPSTPTDVSIGNILWSKATFAGNWQLNVPGTPLVVPFNAVCPFAPPPPAPTVFTFCDTLIQHLGLPAEVPSAIKLTVSNVSPSSIIVEIESADADPVDFLLVEGGSGATISSEQFPAQGKIRRTLNWNTPPPAEVDLNILWSKASFGGNWQIAQGGTTVTFAAACPPDPASIPTMGEWGLFYLAMLIFILGIVYMPYAQAQLQMSTTQGTTSTPMKFSLNQLPFDKAGFLGALKTTLFIVPLGFLFILTAWGEIIIDDIFGMALAIPLVAYLIYLLKK